VTSDKNESIFQELQNDILKTPKPSTLVIWNRIIDNCGKLCKNDNHTKSHFLCWSPYPWP